MSDQDVINLINLCYLVAAVLFIWGMAQLRRPSTARKGNWVAALGMLIAVVATLFDREIVSYEWILAGIAVGAIVGAFLARKVQMTEMPEMVAIFNGFGGAASALLAGGELKRLYDTGGDIDLDVGVTIALGTAIGAVTLTGSLIAAGKLHNTINTNPILLPARNVISALVGVAVLAMGALMIWATQDESVSDNTALLIYVGLILAALLLGILLAIPIGGADMPVLVALFNSYSGLAGAAAGFAIDNDVLIIAGALVGASGLILTSIMTRAMNRSLANVMFGGFGQSGADVTSGGEARPYRSVTAEDAATMLAYAQSAVFVTGYGLAVAQAQHDLKALADIMAKDGCDVKYGIHPVAGRMPGHMNVLLAEADVPYDQLYDLDDINRELENTEIALVIGANDVVNPQARSNPGSPIYGMPIINVDRAQSCIVMKRSMASGFSGIDNDLFYLDRTSMLFGDAKASLKALVAEVEDLKRNG
jgi:NAD(P) transhydrogenase subunit beta